MEIPKFKIHNSLESPERLDYDILGLHKKRTIITGELISVEYYNNYDGIDYADLVVRETRTYNRNEIGLAISRTLYVEWFLTDDSIGTTITNTKYYSATESIDEGISRRKNIIAEAKVYCLGVLGQAYSFDLLNSLKTFIDVYIEGYRQPLIDEVNASTKPYLTSEMKTNITAILTF